MEMYKSISEPCNYEYKYLDKNAEVHKNAERAKK